MEYGKERFDAFCLQWNAQYNIDLFVNRIHCYFPLTSENLIKMSNTVTEVSKDILPNEKLDCVVYGCTSGTVAQGSRLINIFRGTGFDGFRINMAPSGGISIGFCIT